MKTGSAQGSPGIKTDRAVYPEPSLPTLPAAGGKFTDPVFGTEIMRVTDANDCPGDGCSTFYSHWPTFNSNDTRIFYRFAGGDTAKVKEFNATSFTVGPAVTLPLYITPTNCANCLAGTSDQANWQAASWSNLDPDVIFTYQAYAPGMKIYSYNVAAAQFTLVKDFAGLSGVVAATDYLFHMNMSANDDVFSFLQKRVGYTGPGDFPYYLVWKRSTNTVLLHAANTYDANEVHVDESGRWLDVPLNQPLADGTRHEIVDLQNGNAVTRIVHGDPDFAPGHGDLGTGIIVGFDGFRNGATRRSFASPHTLTLPVLWWADPNDPNTKDWTQDYHGTMLADNEDWITWGSYDIDNGNTDLGIFEDEILQTALDGSHRVRRLAHTRSAIDNLTATTGYWAMPKPTISKDGRFIAFTSNWEKSGRYDLFIVKVPPAPALSSYDIKVNFQPSSAPVPDGYLADAGLVYGDRGNGHTYGWDAGNAGHTRDRNSSLSADQRYDTLALMNIPYGGNVWEIAVPNGMYTVRVVAGDADYIDSVYKVNVEGVLAVDGTPTYTTRWIEGTRTVTVSDGKLTVSSAAGSTYNKLCFIDISPADTIKVNFQPASALTPDGYLADVGAAYADRANGYAYGWNADNAGHTRDRNSSLSPDQRHDTLALMSYSGTVWEIAVPNGTYTVHVVAGDADYTDSVYKIDVEGVLTVDGTPTYATRWIEGTRTVTVSDGKLTVSNATGNSNNKVCFIDISPG